MVFLKMVGEKQLMWFHDLKVRFWKHNSWFYYHTVEFNVDSNQKHEKENTYCMYHVLIS